MMWSKTKDGERFVEKAPKTAMGYKNWGKRGYVPDRLKGKPSATPWETDAIIECGLAWTMWDRRNVDDQ